MLGDGGRNIARTASAEQSEYALLLGIDCGATWSKGMAVSATKSNLDLLAAEAGESSNPNVVGYQTATDNVMSLVRRLLGASGGEEGDRVVVAIGGADSTMLLKSVSAVIPSATVVALSDVDLPAFASPGRSSAAVVSLVAGTGSMAVRMEPGMIRHTQEAGGWGWFLGDHGSGVSIGREVVRSVLAELEGGPRTIMTGMLAERLCSSARHDDLRRAIYREVYSGLSPQRAAGMVAPLLTQAASLGDEVADMALTSAVGSLHALVERLWQDGDWIVASGSVSCALKSRLEPALLALVKNEERLLFETDGVAGAVVAAGEAASITIDPARSSVLWQGVREGWQHRRSAP